MTDKYCNFIYCNMFFSFKYRFLIVLVLLFYHDVLSLFIVYSSAKLWSPNPIHAESVYDQGGGSGQNPAHVAQRICGPRSAVERGKVDLR